MLAAENWCVKVDDKIYGPYTSEQMRKFAHVGRLVPNSLIAPAGSRAWREAQKETSFSSYFGAARTAPKRASSKPVFGKRDTANDDAGHGDKRHEARIANFVIIFDVVSGAASRVEAAVLSLGPAIRLADNVWSVTCELTAVGIRNAIAPYLTPRESIFVIDATRGRTSWQNYSPEAHAKITAAHTSTRAAERVNDC